MARKGHGRPATLVDITSHPDDGSSPVGSNEWNANTSTTGVIGFTKKTEVIESYNTEPEIGLNQRFTQDKLREGKILKQIDRSNRRK